MKRQEILAEVMSWIGTPYHHQASRKDVGCDCLGLVRGIYRELCGPEPQKIPAYPQDANLSEGERLLWGLGAHMRKSELPGLPGDVLVFRMRERKPARHCGVLITPTRFIHAVSGRTVSEITLSPWWARRLTGSFTFPHLED